MREITALPQFLSKLFGDIPALKWPVAVLAGVAQYFLPTEALREVAMSAFGLILLDTVTGIVAAASTGKQISSAKCGRVLVKLLGYGSTVAVTSVVAKEIPGLGGMAGSALMTVLSLILMTEAISVLENVRCMGVKMPDFIEKMLKERVEQIVAPKISEPVKTGTGE